tara:strand:- start:309 stop:1061 length:753 start_codon:yes stop_codon:yes gene_type:complete
MKLKIISLLMISLMMSTCSLSINSTPIGYNYNTERTVKYLPRDSFLHILAKEYYEYCYTTNEKKECVTMNSGGASSGSAFVVHNTVNGSLVITADHVCRPSSPRTKQKLILTTLTGEEFEAKIVKRDSLRQNDMCMLYAENLKKPPVKLALNKPLPGAKLFNIAAPAGIFNEGMVPILEGRYNGVSFHGCAMYSIPAAGGSSGSMVLNNNFELVGIIHSLHIRFPTVTLGPRFKVLSKFIREGIKKYSDL